MRAQGRFARKDINSTVQSKTCIGFNWMLELKFKRTEKSIGGVGALKLGRLWRMILILCSDMDVCSSSQIWRNNIGDIGARRHCVK